jgi:hypothetical protein
MVDRTRAEGSPFTSPAPNAYQPTRADEPVPSPDESVARDRERRPGGIPPTIIEGHAAPPTDPAAARMPAAAYPMPPEVAADASAARAAQQLPAPSPPPPAAPPGAPPLPPEWPGGETPDRRRFLRMAVLVGSFVAACVVGYFASTLVTGGGGGNSSSSPAVLPANATSGGLAAVAAKDLPDFRCAVTPAAASSAVIERATCNPTNAGATPVHLLTLTRFKNKAQMDSLYATAQALVKDPAARRRGDCRPDIAWGGRGRWFKDPDLTVPGGRMTCFTEAEPTIRWTVNDSLVFAEATARSSAALGTWWARERLLTIPK